MLHHQSGGHMAEAEDPQMVEAEMEEETGHRESHQTEETQSPQDRICHPTYGPFPTPTMRNQWENSPTSLTETEPKQKHSSTNSTTTSYLTLTSLGLTPRLRRSPS